MIIIKDDLKKFDISYLGFQNHLVKIIFYSEALSYDTNSIKIKFIAFKKIYKNYLIASY